MLKKWFVISPYLLLCLNLQACAWWSQNASGKDTDWHNIDQLSAALYLAFPETPASHIQVTYNHMALSTPKTVSILKISMYLPVAHLKTEQDKKQVRKKIRSLLLDWKQPNIECLTIHFSEHQSYFDKISIPLKQVSADLTCG
mgnify:CR=1 FL=1